MIFANLDMIVRRTLLEKGLPIHYYLEVMLHQSAAIRELSKDSLKIINTVTLPVNSYSAIDLPDDFKDDVGVAIAVGNLLQPVPKKSSITPLRQVDDDGNYISYSTPQEHGETTFGFVGSWFWYWNISDYGEPTGKLYGAGGGAKQNGYAVFKERRQIQLSETFTSGDVVLMYVSSGQSVDNATQIDWDAFAAIQAYSNWKQSGNADLKDSPEARTWYNERRLLRANLNDLTLVDLKNIMREQYRASMKN